MAGEMPCIDPVTGETPDGGVYTLHAAIAKAVGGTIQPFDTYQGPYVVVGKDVRMGERPYQLAVQGVGVIRLWVGTDDGWPDYLARVYREDTDTLSEPFEAYGPHAEEDAAQAALSLLPGELIPSDGDWERLRSALAAG
mgnify:FL=1